MPSHILVVEDDELLRELTAESLSSLYAFKATACANADEALDLLRNGLAITLVFTDIHMSGAIDGVQLAQEIWRNWPHIPVLLTSGHAVLPPDALPQNARFLPKPWTFEQVGEQIKILLSSQNHLG